MGNCHTCGPNEALVKTGCLVDQAKIVDGGFVFVLPCCQQVANLDLSVMTLEIPSPLVYTQEGVGLGVTSVAQVKISRVGDALKNAAGQFLGMSKHEVENVARQTLEGHQRAIMGTLTVEEIYKDRKKFAKEVREVAGVDMGFLGMEIVSYTIRDITDDHGYLDALGKKRTAEVKRDAAIGEAEAKRDSSIGEAEASKDAGIREAEAKRLKMAATYDAETQIADSERQFRIQKASYDQEVNARQAEAALAGELQTAKTRQGIVAEEMEIKVVERTKQIELENQEIMRKEKQLNSTVKLPAEANRYKVETEAEAQKIMILREAEANAEAIRTTGEAEAQVIRAKGEAEAAQMEAKAKAWHNYSEAAYLDMIIAKLPEIASAIAKPLEKTEKIVMVSSGGGDVGVGKFTAELGGAVANVPAVVEGLTGIDLTKSLKRMVDKGGSSRS